VWELHLNPLLLPTRTLTHAHTPLSLSLSLSLSSEMFIGSPEQIAIAWARWEDNKLFTRKLLRQWKVWWAALWAAPWETLRGRNDKKIAAAAKAACAEIDGHAHVAVRTSDAEISKAANNDKQM